MKTFTFDDLVEWATRLPAWMQEALRLLLENGTLEDGDVVALAALAKRPYQGLAPDPVAPPGTSPAEPSIDRVSLTSVRDIARANALAQGPISFSATGLSVVYGDNGCGKSSLARILKKACRSLVPGGPILPSIDDATGSGPARATLEFVAGGVPDSVDWVDRTPSSGPLRSVTVFDAECARAQVARENEISYKPAILRVFEEMVRACTRVKELLESERIALGECASEISDLKLSPDSPAGKFIAALSWKSERDDLAALCDVSADDLLRIDELRLALRDGPRERAQSIEARVVRIQSLAELIRDAGEHVSADALGLRSAEREAARSSAKAAEAARAAFAGNSELSGAGSEVWRALWESARCYSEQGAYPGHEFPVTHDQARCVLCQQELGADGEARLRSFEDFVASDTQRAADAASTRYASGIAKLKSLRLPNSAAVLRDTELVGSSVGDEVRLFLVRAKLRRRHAIREGVGVVAALPAAPDLARVVAGLRGEVSGLREAATAEGRAALEFELRSLVDRQGLSALKAASTRELDRLQAARILGQALSDCGTQGLTKKAGQVAKVILAGGLGSRFAANLARLSFTTTGVQVALGKGKLGSHPYAVKLMADPSVSPAVVLSEGEATAVALAGLFAELDTAGNTSGVVLDDPVSSLDHNFRSAVAKLIAEEARTRQVIVLTHDVAFLWLLRKHGREADVTVHESTLERGYKRHGAQRIGAPFIAKTVSKRISWLRNEIAQATAVLRKEDRGAYERRAEFIYLRMRKTWERAVEERLLNKVVERFGVGVETKRLTPLSDIRESDIQQVTAQMSRCSGFAHDQPGVLHEAIPDPEVLQKDLRELETWVQGLRARGRKG